MAVYRLNAEAADDIERLFEFGIGRYGLEAAINYVDGLIRQLDELASHPLHYQAVDHIRKGYRRSVYGSHSIYFRVIGETVDVMRILGREDPSLSL